MSSRDPGQGEPTPGDEIRKQVRDTLRDLSNKPKSEREALLVKSRAFRLKPKAS